MDDSHALDWHSTNTQSTCIAIAHSRDKIRGSSGRATTAASKHRQHQQQQQKARAWRVPTIVPTCSPQKTHISRAMVLWSVLKRVPGSEGTKVLVGTTFLLGVGSVPFFYKRHKAGHDLFSSEKPEAIERMQEEQKRQRLTNVG